MAHQEYLVRYGTLGHFGRFYPVSPHLPPCRRGQRVMVRSHRGVEVGVVMGVARPGHAAFLPNTTVGQILRAAGEDERDPMASSRRQSLDIYQACQILSASGSSQVEVVDVEVLLDGEHAVLHVTGGGDARSIAEEIGRRFQVGVSVEVLDRAEGPEPDDAPLSCGDPDCGGGQCGTEKSGCSACAVGCRPKEHPTGPSGREPGTPGSRQPVSRDG